MLNSGTKNPFLDFSKVSTLLDTNKTPDLSCNKLYFLKNILINNREYFTKAFKH